jgi:hypothetical protein
MRRKILVVGMLDSIHLARWLEQFVDEEIDFLVFPSKKYRNMHFRIKMLLTGNSVASYKYHRTSFSVSLLGFLDYFFHEVLGLHLTSFSRVSQFTKCLTSNAIDIIHCIEIQGAGYLADDVDPQLFHDKVLIVTNWGSDIYYFSRFPEHARKIRSVLSKATHYSAECQRDYGLALEFGFVGEQLPCIPNAGGFEFYSESPNLISTSKRNQIIIKGYSGEFGRASLPVLLIPFLANRYPSLDFFIYSCSDDISKIIDRFPPSLRKRIRVATLRVKLEHDVLLKEFQKSRIYVGCSESDGISTSFLESIVSGAYPVQSNTSCANEWVSKGFHASLFPLDSSQLQDILVTALESDQLVDTAFERNQKLSRHYLSQSSIQGKALTFYQAATH